MKITEILSPDMVVADLKGTTKPDVLNELAQALAAKYKEIPIGELTAVLAERERLGSTAIGDGIAIPHGKLRGVKKIIGAFGRHREGVDFDSLDGGATHLFFVLVAPEDSASLHLKALAHVSRLLKDGGFRDRLIAATDDAEIFGLIKEEDGKF
ncbi:MAG: PTS sugar transporter subunit IIA [Candidatus Binatus sp.]|uniref:PTS sugar transporter subunit IIA n=1 Tax=Candidatus Binatus sp. TaxID=2811406 RepID=UPI00272610ED|nr:PTS sugar transporter subunit IIA [Candidatus Binatus sp.]MDO8432642.1 PTS sugar transporter subunit IIA [Candidatus Binatus sp.]